MNYSGISYYWLCRVVLLLLLLGPCFGGCGTATDVTKFTDVKTLTGHTKGVNTVAWSPDGTQLASGSKDGTVRMWDTKADWSSRIIFQYGKQPNGLHYSVRSVAWSPDGGKLASGACDNRIKIFDVKTETVLMTLEAHTDCVNSVAWSHDGTKLASAHSDNNTMIWDATTGTNIMNLTGNTGRAYSVAWNPDGSMLAAAANSKDEDIKIWDTSTGSIIKRLKSPYESHGNGNIVSWSPDGDTLASSCESYDICLWNTMNWTYLKTLKDDRPHSTNMRTFTWSPDSSKLASGYRDDGTIDIWDSITGDCLITLSGHTDDVHSVAWSPDGETLASGSDDYTIKIWGEGLPNVHVTTVAVEKINVFPGDMVNITAFFSNNGSADGVNVLVKFLDNGKTFTKSFINVSRGGTNSTIQLWQTNNVTPLGPHTLSVVVGTSNKSVTVMVNGVPNTYVKEVTVDKPKIIVGESATITAIIANNGTADATDVEVKFYNETGLIDTKYVSIPEGGTNTVMFEWNTTNVAPGKHTLKVVVEPSFKETTVNVKAHKVTLVENGWIMWIVILLLFIMALALLASGMKGEKVTKESTKDKTIDEEWKKIDDSEE